MIQVSGLFLAQTVTTMQQLQAAVGRGLAIGVIFAFVYMCFCFWRGITADRSDGSWKFQIATGIAAFAAVGIANILFNIFFPGQAITVNFN